VPPFLGFLLFSLWCTLHLRALDAGGFKSVISKPPLTKESESDVSPVLPLPKESWDLLHKLAYIMILSADGEKYRDRRQLLRDTWLQWVLNGEYRGVVDYGFHVMLCADRASDHTVVNSLYEEWQQHGDVTMHKSRHKTQRIVLDNRQYEFCGLEAEHRLQVSEHVLALSVNYSFITAADDDGILCMPSYVQDLRMLPRSNLIWGKFWCKLKVVRPDSNWITFSSDLLRRLAVSLRSWGLKPLAPPNGMPPSTPEETGERLPFGIAIARILVYYLQDLGERIFVLDDRERIDTQQDWVITHLQGSSFPKAKKYAEIADIFRHSICKRLIWVHRATDPILVMAAYKIAREKGHMAHMTAASVSLSPADICAFSRRLPERPPELISQNGSQVVSWSWEPGQRQWSSSRTIPACRNQLESDTFEDSEWVEELCSHRFIFLRGQHPGGLEFLRGLVANGMEKVLSFHGDHSWVPEVPRYDGQYLQLLWPWEKPSFMRACFCGCSSDADWTCWHLCPKRTELWASKARAKQLYYSWRLFWNMTKPFQLEQSAEMGAKHLQQFFPEVSTVVYLMRHPLVTYNAIMSFACADVAYFATCMTEWLVMWSRIPAKNVLVVRYENAVIQPDFVRVLLQQRLGLRKALQELDSGSAVIDDSETKYHGPDILALAASSGFWTTENQGAEITKLASSCLTNSSCSMPPQSARRKALQVGYDVLAPSKSPLGQGWPLVDLQPLQSDPIEHAPLADCNNRRLDKCQKAAGWLSQFKSSCDDK